jgi:hypothetical protein
MICRSSEKRKGPAIAAAAAALDRGDEAEALCARHGIAR